MTQAQENNVPQQDLIGHWESIVERLSSYLNLMKANNVSLRFNKNIITAWASDWDNLMSNEQWNSLTLLDADSTIPGQQINHTNILLHQSSAPKQACMFTSSNISFSFVFFSLKVSFPWLTESFLCKSTTCAVFS